MKLNKTLLDSLGDAASLMDVKNKADALGIEMSPEDAEQLWSILESGVSAEELCNKISNGANSLSFKCNPFTYCDYIGL